MYCSCGHAGCDCGVMCFCCPFMCECLVCLGLRKNLAAFCLPCGGYMPTLLCEQIRLLRTIGVFPNAQHFRDHGHHLNNRSEVERLMAERFPPETSPSPPREGSPSENPLQFNMDDDFSAADAKSTGAKNQGFQCSSNFSSDERFSGIPLDLRGHSKSKRTKSAKCKMPIKTPLQKPHDAASFKLREARKNEIVDFTQDVAGCLHHNSGKSASESEESRVSGVSPSRTVAVTDFNRIEVLEKEMQIATPDVSANSHHNPNRTFPKLEESQVAEISSEHKLHATGLKGTQSHESDIIGVPDCSYKFTSISKQKECEITDSASHKVSQLTDEYDSDFLPSNLHIDSPPSTFLTSKRSPSNPLSASAPATYDLSQPRKLKHLEQNESIEVGSQTSSTSDFPEFEALQICDSEQIDKSTSSDLSPSVEILPENILTEEKQDEFHVQPVIASNSVESSRVNNSETEAESTQPGASDTLSSYSPELQCPEKSKSARRRTLSKSDSSADSSRVQSNDSSEDGTPTNKSSKK